VKPIEIIGGGLAGLALGIALRRNDVPVTLFEAMRYPRHRVCGEFISGTSQSTLETLSIDECLDGHLLHRSTAWYDGDGFLTCFDLPYPAIAISRYLLDERLAQYFRSLGGVLEEQSRRDTTSNTPGTLWCAGRKVVKGKAEWMGCKMHLRGIPMRAGLEMHLGRNGYVGLSQIEDGWINLCGLFRIEPSLRATKEELIPAQLEANGLKELAERVRGAEWRPQSISGISGFALGKQQAPNNTLGDAHSIIPPFTGNGMSMALQSAECALPHIIDYSRDRCDWSVSLERIETALHSRFRSRLRWAGLVQNLLLSSLWQKPLTILAKAEMLPIRPLYHLTRN
jgi:menaquinone-9 beta-reductase